MAWVQGSDHPTPVIKVMVDGTEVDYYIQWERHQLALRKGRFVYYWESPRNPDWDWRKDEGVDFSIMPDKIWPAHFFMWSEREITEKTRELLVLFDAAIARVPVMANGQIDLNPLYTLSRPFNKGYFFVDVDPTKPAVVGPHRISLKEGKYRVTQEFESPEGDGGMYLDLDLAHYTFV